MPPQMRDNSWSIISWFAECRLCDKHQTYNFKITLHQRGELSMKLRQINRQQGRNPPHSRQKKVSVKPIRASKDKYKGNKGEKGKMSKPRILKGVRKEEQVSLNELFHSMRAGSKEKKQKERESNSDNKQSKVPSNTQFEESTASRQFKLHIKKGYDDPNGEYFGSKISVNKKRKSGGKKAEKEKGLVQLSKSLEVKIRTLRKVEEQHESESQSLKSQMSDQEMRRLKKIHSFERVKLMNQIIDLQEKIIKKKHRI